MKSRHTFARGLFFAAGIYGVVVLRPHLSTWSATNRYIKAIGRNPIEPVRDALTKVWGSRSRTGSSCGHFH